MCLTIAFSGLKPQFRLIKFWLKLQDQYVHSALSNAVSTTDAAVRRKIKLKEF